LHALAPVRALLGRLIPIVATIALATGCASSRVGSIGPLTNREPLVTLVVTEDRQVVQRECKGILAPGTPVGCRMTRTVALSDGRDVRTVTIVRYTDSLPSQMSFEIEVHELCHTVASLQQIDDPCHVGNDGLLTAHSAARIR
jgi:hypothetical protein